MVQTKKSFLEILKVWKRKSWTLFASEKGKRFWCNLTGQYKVTLFIDPNEKEKKPTSHKIIYIGEDVKKAYQIWLDN